MVAHRAWHLLVPSSWWAAMPVRSWRCRQLAAPMMIEGLALANGAGIIPLDRAGLKLPPVWPAPPRTAGMQGPSGGPKLLSWRNRFRCAPQRRTTIHATSTKPCPKTLDVTNSGTKYSRGVHHRSGSTQARRLPPFRVAGGDHCRQAADQLGPFQR